MKRTFILSTLVAGLLLAGGFAVHVLAQENNYIPEYQRRAGWRLLFDGKSTDGWRNFKKDSVNPGWVVENGELIRRGQGAGDLITKEKFQSFNLFLEYKISEGGNSGLMFHVTEEGEEPWHTGPEVQIQDNVQGKDPQKSGWLYQLYPGAKDATKPAGEWNELHVFVTSKACEIRLNNVPYARFVIGSEDWNEKVAKSKFAQFPLFGKSYGGHICLQDHGNEVAFRNIRINTLTDEFWPAK